ncbi:MAG: DUF456 domain-containing protein [Candidatus Doudnabacteria bacterium]|nr:DUF456 domain-containing protein [Candidatus Doudnabacteria bacterium]
MESKEIIIALASGLLILIGGLGSLLPILPGPPLSFAGLWLYAWYTDYQQITPLVLIVFGVLTVLTFVVDFFAPALGARGYKASSYGVVGSMIGAFAGIFFMGPLGIIIGPFIGGFVGELIYARNMENAIKVATGAFVGFVIGSLFKIAVILGMMVYFVYVLIF